MQQRIVVAIVLVIALIFAMVLGTNVALADYERLGVYAVVGITVYFFLHGWKNVWWFAALLLFSGAAFYQGFMFEGDHLFVAMLCLASVISLLSRRFEPVPLEMRNAGSRSTAVVLGLLLAYGAIHFAFNYVNPYVATQYSVKTAAKAYFECYASMGCFFWLLVGPYRFNLKAGWSTALLWIILIALLGNVVVRVAMFLTGFQAVDGLGNDLQDHFFYVPVINMQAGIYTLRFLCPIALVILLMVASAPGWWRSQSVVIRLVVVTAVGLCLVGSVLSGGRATVLFCVALAFLVGVVRRQVAVMAVLGTLGVGMVAFANIFSYEINQSAPYYIARSLQLVMLEKGDAYETIEESQYVRNLAIEAALEDWQRDNRTLLTGRSVYAITWADAEYARKMGSDGFVENALTSGRTHNLVTDLLMQYGAIGFLLYMAAYLAVIRYFWKLSGHVPKEAAFSSALAGAMKIYLPLVMVYQLLGGNFMPMSAALVIGLIRADLLTFQVRSQAKLPITEQRAATAAPRQRLEPAAG